MKSSVSALLFAAALLLSVQPGPTHASGKLTVHFFGSSTCGECLELRDALLRPLAQQYSDKMELRLHDIDQDSSFRLLSRMEEQFHVPSSSAQELFVADTFLLGYADIKAHGRKLIEDVLADPRRWHGEPVTLKADSQSLGEVLKHRFRQFTFLSILAAGLVDGINPCAIATIIFLISFLATRKKSRREVLTIGMAFTGTVFVTYLLLGLGAFKVLTMLEGYHWASKMVRWLAVAFAGVFALYSFRDAYVYSRSGKSTDIKIQLPKALKMQIHKVISGNLSRSGLVLGSIITGFLVTLLEAVCTGQVYLPTIILMTREQGLRLTGWLYLIFYNFLFVLPLLIIMALAYYGLKWNDLAKATQKHMVLIKVLLGVVLAALAVFLGIAG